MNDGIDRRVALRALLAGPALAAGCGRDALRGAPSSRDARVAEGSSGGSRALPRWGAPRASASSAFWRQWGDGRAEMIGYEAITPRYGHLRRAELALVYVTEPFSRRTLIKDDDARGADRMDVLKLNVSERFQTGVYPYSVLTSVFCPTDAIRSERFSPAKITLSAQEWCGHVYLGVWPDEGAYALRGMSYFASEGEVDDRVRAPADALYEDALLIQLRELDGPFHGGRDWEGALVPALWRNRRAHRPLEPVSARITRREVDRDLLRFSLESEGFTRTFDVERGGDRRVVGWSSSDGARARLLRSTRMAYWSLHGPGDEARRVEFGLDPTPLPAIAPDGTERVGF